MRLILLAMVLFVGLLPAARAQQEADERYIAIYSVLQQADELANSADTKKAYTILMDAQAQLQQFHKVYPDWNPAIVNFRLEDLASKIETLKNKLGPQAFTPAAPSSERSASPASNPASSHASSQVSDESAQLMAEASTLRSQLETARAENQNLQAKLKEALSSAAPPDSRELDKAQERIRALTKENNLLRARVSLGSETNQLASLRQQLSDALDKYSAEQAHSQKLSSENAALQRDLRRAAQNATTDDLSAKLKDAKTQIASLQTDVKVANLEKSALETKVKQMASVIDQFRAQNLDGRIRDLTAERDELTRKLAAADKHSGKQVNSNIAELNKEIETLYARLAVVDAKAIPYSPDELALMRETPPQPTVEPVSAPVQASAPPTPAPASISASTAEQTPASASSLVAQASTPATVSSEHSIRELPPGAAELVTSAQKHFANHEYDAAEADYHKILDRDENNGLVLANLAAIEMQENKLADAEKHITAALAKSPNDVYNLSTLGYLKFRQEKYDEALDVLSRAAKADPNNPEIQNYLGVTLSHKGFRVQAETSLRRAIQISPLYGPAHNNLAVIYLNQTPPLPQLARWHYQKALAAGQPRNSDLEKLLAQHGAPVDAP